MTDITIAGGSRKGSTIKWFGNVIYINGVKNSLHRVTFHDGTRKDFYAKRIGELDEFLNLPDVRRIEIFK